MKRTEVVLALVLIAAARSPVVAQEKLEFTLDEVDQGEATEAPPEPKPAAKAVDTGKETQRALGAVRWGMSKPELLELLRAQIRAEFEQRIKVQRDIMRQDALYQEMDERSRRVSENFVAFDGSKTGWDVSPVHAEFTQGNREAMLMVAGKNSRDLYFFIQGKLWKWYRELTPEAVSASNSDEALSVISEPFGRGKPQAERVSEANVAYDGTTWSDGITRVTAMHRGTDLCLILEDVHTLDHLAVLRHSPQPNSTNTHAAAAIDAILLRGPELEARH